MGNKIDLSISNGTCYYDPWEKASSNIIPCGNAANAIYSCCQAGDVCLDENACYNKAHRTTYMAGCTDPNFADTSCPQKDTSNQQLLGLVQCEGDDATTTVGTATTVLWSGCPGPTSRTALGAPSACACTGTAGGGLIWMTSSLAGLATLPASLGGEITWAKGVTPGVTTSPGATGLPTATESGSIEDGEGLSRGAKAGIAVIVVVLLVIALVGMGGWIFIRRRRQHSRAMRLGTPDAGQCAGISRQETAVGEGEDVWGRGSGGSFTGYKAELPAEPRWMSRAELPGDDVYSVHSRRIEDESARTHGVGIDWIRPVSPMSRMTPDDRASGAVSDVSSVFTVSRMGSTHTPAATPTLDSIAETHGR